MLAAVARVGVKRATGNHLRAHRSQGAVISFGDVAGAHRQRCRIDGAGGVAHIGDDIVVAVVAVAHSDTGDSDRFAGSRVCVGEGERAAAQTVLLVTIAGVSVKRAAGNHRSTRHSQCPIIGFGDIAGAHRQRGLGDGNIRQCRLGQRIVARQSCAAAGNCDCCSHSFAARIRARQRAVSRATHRQCLARNQTIQHRRAG